MRIIADLHTHTSYGHGKGTVEESVTAAMSKGLRAIGITGHGPRSAPWVGAAAGELGALRRAVAEIDRRATGIKVLAGVECNIVSARGDLDVPFPVRRELDLVLAGLHPSALPNSGRDWLVLTGGNWAARFSPAMRRKARINNTRAIVEAVRKHEIDVITHPGHHLDIDTTELAKICAARGTALEINARHHELAVEFCRAAAKAGARFVINSDAHSPGDVGDLSRGLEVAEAAGLRPEQVLNSDQGGLFAWLAERRERRLRSARPSDRAGLQSGWAGWAEQTPLDRERGKRQERRTERARSGWADWSEQGKVH